MSANVFANGMEVSGKASDNKSIAAMPDVCMSPPSPPAGPVPIPYPNTAMASDTADGTKTITIGGKEAGMKNSSTYSKSTGDEPATQSFGANVGSHKIQGAMKFSAWSSDVKLEGANAIRMGDMTTHNHSNPQGVSGLTASVAGVAVEPPVNCEELAAANDKARDDMGESGKKTYENVAKSKTTITHAVYSPPSGGSMALKACSRVIASVFDGGFVKGKQTHGEETKTVVCGKEFTYRKSGRPLTSHTESRILETIHSQFGSKPGGSLLMSINWNKTGDPADPDPNPCSDCQRLVCAAAKCIDIKLCIDDKPTPPDCPKE
jgi:hypothetical protein